MRFAIFTHVQHKKDEDLYYGYAPYIREMNLWLKNVQEVEIVAPLSQRKRARAELSYFHERILFREVPSLNFLSVRNIFSSTLNIPKIIYRIGKVMAKADHLHLRCPGNIGLLACISQIFFPGKLKSAKYAGNWDPQADQPWTYRLQKWILSNTFLTRNMQVLVYGEWPEQTKNIKPFFTASFSEKEISLVREKNFEGSVTFLFVGNLVPGKHPLKAIQLVQEIKSRLDGDPEAREVFLEIFGDGPERKMLEAYCKDENLEGLVRFQGNRSLEELKEAYQKAHFVILPSESEGWPKAIAEGMFFGCIPIATPVSCVHWMLGNGERGVLLEETGQQPTANSQKPERSGKRSDVGQKEAPNKSDLVANAEIISSLLQDPEEIQRRSKAAKAWSQQYTIEKFEIAIKEVLDKN